jgi:sulfopyruvate decarboxylase subunit beta
LRRDEAISVLAEHRQGIISVAIMQTVMAWHAAGQASIDHLDAMGCMGSAMSLGFGIALGRPDRKVMVLDGDGSLLMQLGSLVSIAAQAPPNFYHFVFENDVYETSGNQPLPGVGAFDLCQLAVAAGYPNAFSFEDAAELKESVEEIFATRGPVFVRLRIAREDRVTPWPRVSMAAEVQVLRDSLART